MSSVRAGGAENLGFNRPHAPIAVRLPARDFVAADVSLPDKVDPTLRSPRCLQGRLRARTLAIALPGALLATFAAARAAHADGGYYQGAFGARASGRGGAFVARADDLTAVEYNPAGLADLEGTLIQLGDRLSYNAYGYTRSPTLDYGHPQNGMAPQVSFSTALNSKNWQALEPMLGVASKLGLQNWGFALAAYAPPGNASESFPQDGGQRYMMVDRQAIILKYVASAAWKYEEKFGLGVTFEWIHVPRLDYSLIIDGTPSARADNPVSSSLDILATTRGSSTFTPNSIVGAWFRPSRSWQFGAAGQVIPAQIVTHSTLSVQPYSTTLGAVTLSRPATAQRNANDVTVTLPLPLMARVGGRYRYFDGDRELFDVELDVEYETWSRVQQFTVATNGLRATAAGFSFDINDIVIPKAWQNTLSVKAGGDVVVFPRRWVMRAGAFYETAVSPAANSNVDFPGGAQQGVTLGTSLLFGHLELALAYQMRLMSEVNVSESQGRVYQQVPGSPCAAPYTDTTTCNSNLMGRPAPVVNAGRYQAVTHFLSLGLLFRFGT